MAPHRHAPRSCPVCATRLELTRLSCRSCGTELSGSFAACDYCALDTEDRALLRVFLASRGNMKDLERHLGVSYPTARARFDALLGRLGIDAGRDEPAAEPADSTEDSPSLEVLEALARGNLDVDTAADRLTR